MAAYLFDEFRDSIGGNPSNSQPMTDWQDDTTISTVFIDTGDAPAPDQATSVDVGDITTSTVPVYASAANLTSRTSTVTSNVMVMDATDTTHSALSGDQSEAVMIFRNTTTSTTSNLISYHDDYTGLPITPGGGDVTIVWAATGIIRI